MPVNSPSDISPTPLLPPGLLVPTTLDPYAGQDFQPTEPGDVRSYGIDFVHQLAVLLTTKLTIAGSVTAGDTINVTITAPGISSGSVGTSYVAGGADTIATIAASLGDALGGLDEFLAVGGSVTVNAAVITIAYPPGLNPILDASVLPITVGTEPTETAEFSEGNPTGETLTSSVSVSCVVFTVQGGVLDPLPSDVIGEVFITGTAVIVQTTGDQVAGNNYRITLQPTTSLGNRPKKYSHLLCLLPQ